MVLNWQRRKSRRWFAVTRRLLIGVCELNEQAIRVATAKHLQAGREVVPGKPHGHGNSSHTGRWSNELAVVSTVVLIAPFQVYRRLPPGRIDQGIHV